MIVYDTGSLETRRSVAVTVKVTGTAAVGVPLIVAVEPLAIGVRDKPFPNAPVGAMCSK